SQVDSRTILDTGGAEKLLGRGDMLYMPTEAAKPKRLQGCYVSDAETERLVYFWGNQRKEETAQIKIDELISPAVDKNGYAKDSLLEEAKQLAREHEQISASFLQRRLHIGYPRAARIMDQLGDESGQDESGQGG
ncbi:MAG: DNA translocase FtsK, partial [Dehalococcoidales bacterium]|nr:DNA translocase FtsK [Dehalococcoidales bacterium]